MSSNRIPTRSQAAIVRLTMRFTDEPTHLWDLPEPSPVEFPVPRHDPALPEHEPVGV
jgi:hypothetical protein